MNSEYIGKFWATHEYFDKDKIYKDEDYKMKKSINKRWRWKSWLWPNHYGVHVRDRRRGTALRKTQDSGNKILHNILRKLKPQSFYWNLIRETARTIQH